MLFLDEIHRMARPAEEMLYVAMEDFRVDVVVGKGPGATAIPLDIAPFTLVGATTRAGLLPAPLRDRFGFVAHMDFYDARRAGEHHRTARRGCSASRSTTTAPPRSPAGPAARPGSPTGCCAGSATTPRYAPTGSITEEIARRRPDALRGRRRRAWTGSTGRCSTRCCAGSAAGPSGCPRWPSPWGRSRRRSRWSRSRSWCGRACSPAPRAGGSRPRRPGGTWACHAATAAVRSRTLFEA